MSKPDGGPAFPDRRPESIAGCFEPGHGMSLRDYFAGQVMPHPDNLGQYGRLDRAADVAYAMADAMLVARNKETTKD